MMGPQASSGQEGPAAGKQPEKKDQGVNVEGRSTEQYGSKGV